MLANSKSLVALVALATCLGACASSRSAPPRTADQQSLLATPPAPGPGVSYRPLPPPVRQARGGPGQNAPTPATGPVSPSNPSPGIVAVNRSVPQPLGPNSPPPSSFENSCAPAPYVFQSKAGYEAVRVKDCATDQLLYLPSSAQAQISGYVSECQRRCGR